MRYLIFFLVLLIPAGLFSDNIEDFKNRNKKNKNITQQRNISGNEDIIQRLKNMRSKSPLTKLPDMPQNNSQKQGSVIQIPSQPVTSLKTNNFTPSYSISPRIPEKPFILGGTDEQYSKCWISGYIEKDSRRLELLDCGDVYRYREKK